MQHGFRDDNDFKEIVPREYDFTQEGNERGLFAQLLMFTAEMVARTFILAFSFFSGLIGMFSTAFFKAKDKAEDHPIAAATLAVTAVTCVAVAYSKGWFPTFKGKTNTATPQDKEDVEVKNGTTADAVPPDNDTPPTSEDEAEDEKDEKKGTPRGSRRGTPRGTPVGTPVGTPQGIRKSRVN